MIQAETESSASIRPGALRVPPRLPEEPLRGPAAHATAGSFLPPPLPPPSQLSPCPSIASSCAISASPTALSSPPAELAEVTDPYVNRALTAEDLGGAAVGPDAL